MISLQNVFEMWPVRNIYYLVGNYCYHCLYHYECLYCHRACLSVTVDDVVVNHAKYQPRVLFFLLETWSREGCPAGRTDQGGYNSSCRK